MILETDFTKYVGLNANRVLNDGSKKTYFIGDASLKTGVVLVTDKDNKIIMSISAG